MNLTIEQSQIEKAVGDQLQKIINEGIGYEGRKAMEKAIADAVTPEVVKGFVEATMRALTDEELTRRILDETHRAIGFAVQEVVQEAIVSMVARLRGWSNRNWENREHQAELNELRAKLFPK